MNSELSNPFYFFLYFTDCTRAKNTRHLNAELLMELILFKRRTEEMHKQTMANGKKLDVLTCWTTARLTEKKIRFRLNVSLWISLVECKFMPHKTWREISPRLHFCSQTKASGCVVFEQQNTKSLLLFDNKRWFPWCSTGGNAIFPLKKIGTGDNNWVCVWASSLQELDVMMPSITKDKKMKKANQ